MRTGVALLIACSGCSSLFGLDSPARRDSAVVADDAMEDAAPDMPIDAPSNCFDDDFEAAAIGSEWNVFSMPTAITQSSGTLNVMPAGTVGIAGMRGLRMLDASQTISVQTNIVEVTSQAQTGCQSYVGLEFPTMTVTNQIVVAATSNLLVLQASINGTITQTTAAFDPNQHKFWRLAYDQNANLAAYAASQDGMSWTGLGTLAASVGTTARVSIGAGAYNSMCTAPGKARFESVNAKGTGCVPP